MKLKYEKVFNHKILEITEKINYFSAIDYISV